VEAYIGDNSMKILVLGGSGMLGSMVSRVLVEQGYDVISTSSTGLSPSTIKFSFAHGGDLSSLCIPDYDCVVNCIGLIKQKSDVPFNLYSINSVMPRMLTDLCFAHGVKLIHFSTDCIFSGSKSTAYGKNDACDALDHYGVSKYLGEDNRQILFRTSIFGPSKDAAGLFEWFRRNTDKVNGYTNHIWSGLTTLELARHVVLAIKEDWKPSLYQLASDPISKYNLLTLTNETFQWGKSITPFVSSFINRALISDIPMKSIEQQIGELKSYCDDWNYYE
jgi:dTDP-4-dehydrorhamnose reductase